MGLFDRARNITINGGEFFDVGSEQSSKGGENPLYASLACWKRRSDIGVLEKQSATNSIFPWTKNKENRRPRHASVLEPVRPLALFVMFADLA